MIFDGGSPAGSENKIEVKNINAYLVDAPDVFVETRNKPLCDVPKMIMGNMPADGGNLIINSQGEYDDFIRREPKAKNTLNVL